MSVSASPPPRQYLSGAIQRRGSMLLNQQCWLWGQDVKRAEGNLLLLHGFDRQRPPVSQDTLLLAGNLKVGLWGFGMYFGEETGTFSTAPDA
jgi:hypothetical protein